MLVFLLLVLASVQQPASLEGCDALMAQAQAETDRYLEANAPGALAAIVTTSRAARACYGEDHPSAAQLYNYETYALAQQRQYRAARDAFDRFFRGPVRAPDSLVLAKLYRRSGYVAQQAGQLHLSADHFNRARLFAATLPSLEQVPYLIDAGETLQFAERHAEARRLYREARRILRPLEGQQPDVREPLARAMLKEAESFAVEASVTGHLSADTAAVIELSRSALRFLEDTGIEWQVLGPLLHASTLNMLGRPLAALPYLRRAYGLAQRHPNPSRRVLAARRLGSVLLTLEKYDEALGVLKQAETLAVEFHDPYAERYIHHNLGMLYRKTGAWDEAEASYWRSISTTESLREGMSGSEVALSSFSAWQSPYRSLADLLLERGRVAEAFQVLDRTRARFLQDLRLRQRIAQQLPDHDRDHLDRLAAQEDSLRGRLASPDLSRFALLALDTELQTVQQKREALLHPLAAATPQPRLRDLQRHLRQTDRTLVSYFLQAAAEGPSYAFVLRPDTLVAVRLPISADSLRTRLARVSSVWTREVRELSDTQFDLRALQDLYAAVFEPLVPYVPEGKPVVVIPDGGLVELPFAMLVQNAPGHYRYRDADYLVRRHPLSMELAAAVLLEPRVKREAHTLDIVALGRSQFGYPAPSPLRSGAAVLLPDLPHVPEELKAVSQGFERARTGLDARATEDALLSQAAKARVIHVASHVHVFPDRPEASEIQLWPDSVEADDGVLHLYELANKQVPAELVVLSGCSSARGQRRNGEGMIGFQYALRAVGAESVLATLWQVDDAATVDLMARFYDHLRDGEPKDRALQLAQIGYLEAHRGALASPFYWAAPVLTGRPDALPPPRRLPVAWWIALGLGALAGALLLPRLSRTRG